MAIVLHDILITIEQADYQFTNPVQLLNADSEVIGNAELENRSDRIYATLRLEKDDAEYLDTYPTLVADSSRRLIQSVALSAQPNEDLRIERLKDQELFQSSAGADHADLQ